MLARLSRTAITAARPLTRNVNVQTGPALVKVSAGEKVAHSVVMVGAWLFIPAWVLMHMKEYRGVE